jgi:hypothetical protein
MDFKFYLNLFRNIFLQGHGSRALWVTALLMISSREYDGSQWAIVKATNSEKMIQVSSALMKGALGPL